MTKQCPICGKYFKPMKTGRRKYCSEKCAKSRNNNDLRDMSALNFNEPMQVELEGDGYADNGQIYYDYGKCPKCGWDFEDGDKDWEEPYCCHCGQKLHWFESEDKE